MDVNLYAMGLLAQCRLADLRAAAARHHLAREARPARPLRRVLGAALVRLGTRLVGGLAPAQVRV